MKFRTHIAKDLVHIRALPLLNNVRPLIVRDAFTLILQDGVSNVDDTNGNELGKAIVIIHTTLGVLVLLCEFRLNIELSL